MATERDSRRPDAVSRRMFLRRMANSAAGAAVLGATLNPVAEALLFPDSYPARALGPVPVYADHGAVPPADCAPIGHLAPDSVHSVKEVRAAGMPWPLWLRMEHGFVPAAAMQPMRLSGSPAAPIAGDGPLAAAWYTVRAPTAPLRAYAAAEAPIRDVLGYGAAFVALGRIQDMRGRWWLQVPDPNAPGDGPWTLADACVACAIATGPIATTLRATLDPAQQTLHIRQGSVTILALPFAATLDDSHGQPLELGELRLLPPDERFCWSISAERGIIRGVWWHNAFQGVRTAASALPPATVPLIEIPADAAGALAAFILDADARRLTLT